ncbi:hypothetical protein ACIA8K_26570 [Catenuloplanes sp. NPDC051500]|uniref:hypothetical protein n=1 Tax=Catenuloplanes sp. NPDC051500 TaxID=3363959 RepID=UPI0037A0554F
MDLNTALQLTLKAHRIYRTINDFVSDTQETLKGHAGREYETARAHIDNAARNPSRARDELNSAHSALDRVHRT